MTATSRLVTGRRRYSLPPIAMKVVLVSTDTVGSSMAGPGIRYAALARKLAGDFDVTLVAPNRPDLELAGVRIVGGIDGLRDLAVLDVAEGADALVAQHLAPRAMTALAHRPVRTIYDLYDPLAVENLFLRSQSRDGRSLYRLGTLMQEVALATGDAFLCAGELQRDFWRGALAVLGRVDATVEIVPFGLPEEPPRASQPVLKGVVDGIGESDSVLLWGGGIWDWLDPLMPIEAVGILARERPDVKLYFLGGRPPNPVQAFPGALGRATERASRLGLLGRHVFFNEGWVPYEERQAYLLEADLGVSAHLDTLEARYAFRARLLDCFWAGLPVVTTTGDALADIVEREGLGRTVPCGDADAFAEAVAALLDDEGERERRRQAIAAVAARFTWPAVAAPLKRLLAEPRDAPPPTWRARIRLAEHFALRARVSLSRRGVRGSLARLARR
jgi:hypothetical protein